MRLDPRSDLLRTLSVSPDGTILEGEPIVLRNTLAAHAFGLKNTALLRLRSSRATGFDAIAEKLKLTNALAPGIRGLHVLGSGHGVKKGRLYAATEHIRQRVHAHFDTAEDALAYASLLFSEAQHVLQLDTAKLTSHGAGDGQGWIDADVLREHDLPVRQIQIRALFNGALAKGTLLPVEGLAARKGVQVLLHETQLKGKGRDVSGTYLLAVREVAEVRSMRSSWTWTQFLDEDIQELLFQRYAEPQLAVVSRAMESNDSALAFLGALDLEGDEQTTKRDLLTSLLASGLSPRHPWVHRRLLELVRRTYLDAALGLGPIPLTSGMACTADDARCIHEITCNWLPEGEVTILRYPVRDTQGLRLVRNVHRPGIPEGSIAVHPTLMVELDGDVDGDWVAICTDSTVARGVRRTHRRQTPRLPIPPRTRKRSALSALPRVAVDALGATGIGTPTWLVAACIQSQKPEYLAALSLELQCATMSLKWNVADGGSVIYEIQREVELPEWLELAQDREVFASKTATVEDIGLGRWWNRCASHFNEQVVPTRGRLAEFMDVLPYPSGDADVLAEVETLRQSFNRRIAQSDGDEDEIRSAIQSVRDWSSGKTGDARTEFGRTAWYLVHRSRSAKSSGSFAIHAFPDVVVDQLQQATRYRAPVLAAPTGPIEPGRVETIEQRACRRAASPVEIQVNTVKRDSRQIRLVGGWRALAERYDTSREDALRHLAQCVSQTGSDPVPLRLQWVNAPWNGHRVLRATLAEDDPVGYVPEELAASLGEQLEGEHRAHLMLRGRTVHATLIG